jgi:hypothetical protein
MPLYEFKQTEIKRVDKTTFSDAGLHERRDLQPLLCRHVEMIAPDTLVISEEFIEWKGTKRRIDVFGIDKNANLVVIELKRTEDGGHMELQSIRYAAMISRLKFDQVVEIYKRYLERMGKQDQDARAEILKFLGWDEPDPDRFAQDVQIVLVSMDFSPELITSVQWLFDHEISISCIRLTPYRHEGHVLVDVQRIVPLPETEEYQLELREKTREERQAHATDRTRFDIEFEGEQQISQPKNRAIFLISKRLCERGINPEDIARLLDRAVWYSVEGDVNAAEFDRLAHEKSSSGGPNFDGRRWFHGDGELIHANGKTYAFSTQWGGADWHRAMNDLKRNYPQFRIAFSPAS